MKNEIVGGIIVVGLIVVLALTWPQFTSVLMALCAFFFLLQWMLHPRTTKDSTDGPNERSGLSIYTDHATGVQYVGIPLVGMTVRVDAKGNPYIDPKDNTGGVA